jgi:hypothetical protein
MGQATTYAKLDVAREYLDAAMQMYMNRRDYFCAMHLAGAAAELFDRHLPNGKRRMFEMTWKAEKALHAQDTGEVLTDRDAKKVVNWSKNAVKHMNDGEQTISIDAPAEAWWWIEHAFLSFCRLGLPKTPIMWKYQDHESLRMRSELS